MTTPAITHGTLSHEDWLCLSFLSGIGPSRLSRLFTYLNSLHSPYHSLNQKQKADNVFDNETLFADDAVISYELLRALKWPEETAREAVAYLESGTLSKEQMQKRETSLAWLEDDHHHIVLQSDADYPDELKEINVAPAFLYLDGHLSALNHPKIGIVGARRCTGYGRESTKQLAKQLSSHGIAVVSGGARGIDTAAHTGALEASSTPTIAVMGTGLLHYYPKQNRELFEQIKQSGGCLVSEYPLMTDVRPHLFPPRNRIISGLSKGVLVTEASLKSGSLISASYAVQQNREVFALPGRIHDAQAEGCHQLIRQGATLVRSVEDILLEFSGFLFEQEFDPKNLPRAEAKPYKKQSNVSRETFIKQSNSKGSSDQSSEQMIAKQTALPAFLSDSAKIIAKVLETESQAMDFDALIRETSLDAASLMQSLMELELNQCIENISGAYVRC